MKTLLTILSLMIAVAVSDTYAEDAPVTDIHRAIVAHEEGWLNTSRALTAEELSGRIILLDFWTYCCINCMHVIPDLHYLEETFGDDLTVIGVHSAKFSNEKDTANIRNAILRYGITHPVVNDYDFSTWQSFGVRAWPTFVLINPDGKVEQTYAGEGNRNKAEADIRKLLQNYQLNKDREALPIALESDKAPPTYLSFPSKLTYIDDYKGTPALAISDTGNNRIVIITLQGKVLGTIGSGKETLKDGTVETAAFRQPQGMAHQDGKLYVADTGNHALRLVDLRSGEVTTLAGDGTRGGRRFVKNQKASSTELASPWDLAFLPDANQLLIAMAGTHQLWQYDIAEGTVTTVAGNGKESIEDGAFPMNSLSQPSDLSVVGDTVYFVDAETSSLRQWQDGKITTLIGQGLFDFGYEEGNRATARMQHPLGVYADTTGVYVVDSYNHAIRRYDPRIKTLSNWAGSGTSGAELDDLDDDLFNEPNDILHIGGLYYIADTNNHRIVTIDATSKNVAALTIEPPAEQTAVTFAEDIPNALELSPHTVSGQNNTITLALEPGWKINGDAPSYLALCRYGRGRGRDRGI